MTVVKLGPYVKIIITGDIRSIRIHRSEVITTEMSIMVSDRVGPLDTSMGSKVTGRGLFVFVFLKEMTRLLRSSK